MKFLEKLFKKSKKNEGISLNEKLEFDNLILPNKWHKKPYLSLENGYIGGLAESELSQIRKNEKWGLIDYNGNFKIELSADKPIIWDSLIPFKNDNNKIGLKNKKGNVVVPAKADDIKYIEPNFFALNIDSKIILVDEKGQILKTQYEIRSVNDHKFSEGALSVEVWLENNETGGGYIDKQGNSITEFKYRYPRPFSNGLAFVNENDYLTRYFIDKQDKIVYRCPENWFRVGPFDGNVSRVDTTDKGFGFIDKDFNIVIEPKFRTGGYKNGLIHTSKNGKNGILNLKEEIVVPFRFDGFITQIDEHLFIVQNEFFNKKKYDKFSLYNSKTKQLELDFIYDDLKKANNNLLIAKKNNSYGFIDFYGNEITKFIFQSINPIYKNMAWVKIKNKWGVIEIKQTKQRKKTEKAKELLSIVSSKLEDYENFLNEGATEAQLKKLEEFSGFDIPLELKNLLRHTNGEGKNKLAILGFFLSSTERIMNDINSFKENSSCYPESIYQDNMVKPDLYNHKRIPFATDESGQYLCIDYDPDSKGQYGQIIYLPCAEPEPISVIARNFDEYLDFTISSLKNNQLSLYDERDDWDEDDWEEWRVNEESDLSKVYVYFQKKWKDDWTDVADLYNEKRK